MSFSTALELGQRIVSKFSIRLVSGRSLLAGLAVLVNALGASVEHCEACSCERIKFQLTLILIKCTLFKMRLA